MAAEFSSCFSGASHQQGKINLQEGTRLVIINSSLAESELHRLFLLERLRVKVSGSTLPHTCLFPHSLVAFMILPASDILTTWPPTDRSEIHIQVVQNLNKFSELHHKCYILITSPLFGRHEQAVVSLLQDTFLRNDLQFIPLHNSNECLTCMRNITKVTCKPLSEVIYQRMASLRKELESEESILLILRKLGLTDSESMMVLDGCGGLSGLASSTHEDIADLNIDSHILSNLQKILHVKTL